MVRADLRRPAGSSGTGESRRSGWLSQQALIAHVRAALAPAPAAHRRPPQRVAAAARRLAAAARRAARSRPAGCSASEPALAGAGPRAARLPDRDQRVGLLVRAVPLGVRRCSPPPRRATGARSRSSAPTPTTRPATRSRSWPSTRSAIRATRPAHRSSARASGPADHDLHQPRRQARLRPHRPIRVPGHARRRHRDLCARRLTRLQDRHHGPPSRQLRPSASATLAPSAL